jgi:hypothetical protein
MSDLDKELQFLFQEKHMLLTNIDKIDDRIIEIKEEKLKRKNKEVEVVFYIDDD